MISSSADCRTATELGCVGDFYKFPPLIAAAAFNLQAGESPDHVRETDACRPPHCGAETRRREVAELGHKERPMPNARRFMHWGRGRLKAPSRWRPSRSNRAPCSENCVVNDEEND